MWKWRAGTHFGSSFLHPFFIPFLTSTLPRKRSTCLCKLLLILFGRSYVAGIANPHFLGGQETMELRFQHVSAVVCWEIVPWKHSQDYSRSTSQSKPDTHQHYRSKNQTWYPHNITIISLYPMISPYSWVYTFVFSWSNHHFYPAIILRTKKTRFQWYYHDLPMKPSEIMSTLD